MSPLIPAEPEPVEEIRKSMFCGTVMSDGINLPDLKKYSSWDDLIDETKTILHGAADHSSNIAQCYIESEKHILQTAQSECFPEELSTLNADKPIHDTIHPIVLDP